MVEENPFGIFRSRKSIVLRYLCIATLIAVFAGFVQASSSPHEVDGLDSDCVSCQLRNQLISETPKDSSVAEVITEFLITLAPSEDFSSQQITSILLSRAPPRHLVSVA